MSSKKEILTKELNEAKERLLLLKKSLEEYDNLAIKRKEELIQKSTIAEKIIKHKLKELDIKFEFQKIIKNNKYFRIVDFYIPEYNLILEIDGDYHLDKKQKESDEKRTYYLTLLGYNKILRIDNIKAKNISNNDLLILIKSVKPLKVNKSSIVQKILKYKQRINQLENLIAKNNSYKL